MITVGLVGEDPTDTSSIKNLLIQRYKGKVQFVPVIKSITGEQLNSEKFKRSLLSEFKKRKWEFAVVIRDLDAFKSQENKLQERLTWFKEISKIINDCGVFLLNIWELEALILGDIEAFNRVYHTKHKFTGDPMTVKDPKEKLKHLTYKSPKQYKESHCPDLFKELNIDQVESKCAFFKEFLTEFDGKLKT